MTERCRRSFESAGTRKSGPSMCPELDEERKGVQHSPVDEGSVGHTPGLKKGPAGKEKHCL